MEFPVYVHVGPVAVHPHWLFESLAYLVGSRVYVWLRGRLGDTISSDARGWVVVAAFVGAVVGGKLLYWASDPELFLAHLTDPVYVVGGKSVVGAVVGGYIAVELAKRRLGLVRSTGDLFVFPLVLGIAIGRVGCFLTGLDDHTHGLPTSLPWAVDFGDGIPRHPTQLYENTFLLLVLLPILAAFCRRADRREGDLFKLFMVGYLGFRLALESIKPGVFAAGLNAIQWVCLSVLVWYAVRERRRLALAFRGRVLARA
jgi:prolipoprotein diacylglyceryltransferase